ncbi:DUF4931 domain-containing protein [Mesobacillus subterraneus]|uniref:DUF4931 domain-containing protein n=1 Tax=Mesobacillus subterraneus TaxID=285983 RepID=A0A427TV49_9BACI|nr:DUF4931 domain-containing protein [Mesobacillus subterraneus]RSD28353.1 DUF4931 domain-containing protein [Mesobacillus subterraneus]
MTNTHLFFNTAIGVQKPENIRNKNQSCPFCAREELTGIIDEEGPILLLKNKYPVLENAYQTVLVETDVCDEEFSRYSPGHLNRLLGFAIRHWMKMEESGEYRSVVFFKNHGPLSGGTIAHSHMQIVGLYDLDYHEKISEADFTGLHIQEQNDVHFNLSLRPKVGFYEFNIRMERGRPSATFASFIQTAVHYIMHAFPFKCSSYNLFFYSFEGDMICKVVPRFVTTPLFIGYHLPQVPNNLEWMAEDLRNRYFNESMEKEA